MLQGDSSEGEGEEGRDAEEEGDVDMQVTFDSGLETLGERLASKKGSKAAETLWQAYEKRRRCCPNPAPSLSLEQSLQLFALGWHVMPGCRLHVDLQRSDYASIQA